EESKSAVERGTRMPYPDRWLVECEPYMISSVSGNHHGALTSHAIGVSLRKRSPGNPPTSVPVVTQLATHPYPGLGSGVSLAAALDGMQWACWSGAVQAG